ncbi:phage tail assembly chaperone [Microvirga antarctica]|uniref:phage tail assembly chaperone n=1 Tax=Microvirga antarctica TaxID=2819233 RepID=UPI001B300C08|nr:hypothetical protein [Microvirga antarctica]
MPAAYLDRPLLDPHLQLYWDAFWELTSDRPVGMSVGPIPFSSIARWAQCYGMSAVDNLERLRVIVRALDGESLKHGRTKSGREERLVEVAADDVAGVRYVFQGLTARALRNRT